MEPDLPQRVISFIVRYQAMHAFSPSTQDIAVGCKVPIRDVRAALDSLEADGCISRSRASITV